MKDADRAGARLRDDLANSAGRQDRDSLRAATQRERRAPGLSIVVPTGDETENFAGLITHLEQLLARLPVVHLPIEVIFVDDSDEGALSAIRQIRSPLDVRVLRRAPPERAEGRGAAVRAGIRLARAPWVYVMDVERESTPEQIEDMLREAIETASDLVVTGPPSGGFLVWREAVDGDALRPASFKALLETLDQAPQRTRRLRISTAPLPALGAPVTRLRSRLAQTFAKGLDPERAILLVALGVGAFLRLWQINKLGVNSDEAVYAGQAAAIAGDASLEPFFSAFRAHPLLFQMILSLAFHIGDIDLWGRLISAALGLASVILVYKLGALLYSRRVGAIAALFLALMPYHVLVTRQMLLDGPMTLFATLTLYLVARYATSQRGPLLCAAGATMGLAVLSKETSVVLLGALYVFFALAPEIRLRVRHVVGAGALFGVVVLVSPLAMSLSGRTNTGGNYLVWQLFRQPNHEWTFYPATVPEAMGWLVVAAAAGMWFLRREFSWRETLLLSWMAVPVVFFQIWPVKGFQYLLPAAPAVAILAGQALTRGAQWLDRSVSRRRVAWLSPAIVGVIALTLAGSSLDRFQSPAGGELLAGSGGMPGGREAGNWIDENVPEGAQFMTIGPSMANIVQFYGHRKAYGLSVSPNPLHRNPSYEPLVNPDRRIRDNELQYIVWDSYSAARSPFFGQVLERYADRYNARAVHTETITVTTKNGKRAKQPLITIYEVRPA